MEQEEYAARMEGLKAKLYRTAYLFLGDPSAALGAVDEAIYRGFVSLRKLRQPEYVDTWVTRILINACKKELHRRKREQPIDPLPETAAEPYDALPLKDALRRLPPELRDVIALRYFAGYTLAETAQCLRAPQGTVATRQRRALQLLRLDLTEEG